MQLLMCGKQRPPSRLEVVVYSPVALQLRAASGGEFKERGVYRRAM